MSQFYCREDELRKLNKRYAGDKFECIVIYGRRRVGKVSLCDGVHIYSTHPVSVDGFLLMSI